jgi:hypothetical protein
VATLPRGIELHAELLDHAVAHRAQEAHGQQHQVGIHGELRAGNRLELRRRTHAHGVQLLHVAVFVAGEASRGDAPVADAAFFVRALRAQLQRPQRPRRGCGARSSGGLGSSSNWCTERAPWRWQVPRQSAPVSPPPMITTRLPVARISSPGTVSPFVAAVLLRQKLHGEVNALQLAAGNAQVARMFGAAGQQHGVELACADLPPEYSAHVRVGAETSRPSARICSRRRSMRCFSILKLGMP